MEQKRFYMKSEEVAAAPSYVKKTSHTSRIVFVLIFLVLLVILILVGLYFLGSQNVHSHQQTAQSAASPTDVPTATSTPTPVLERSGVSVTILNGSGKRGVAGEISTYLKDLGYTIEKTGNATRFNYEGVTLFVSEEKKEYLSLLEKDLSDKFASVSASMSATLTTDAEVIVGK